MKFPSFSRKNKNRNRKTRTARTPYRRRPTVEPLEDRLVPTSLVTGTVFRDLNVDTSPDKTEPALGGLTVFADVNQNGHPDQGEATTTTDANGTYALVLVPGLYQIRVEPALNQTVTSPTNGSFDATVTDGLAQFGRDFGIVFTSPAAPHPEPLTSFPTVQRTTEAYVQELYRQTLGRDAEPAGLAFWESQLPTGVPATDAAFRAARDAVASGIWDSAEHRGLQVENYYQTLLGRGSDAAGKTYWVQVMQAGATEADVMQGFATSPEYRAHNAGDTAFVTGLYRDLLGRTANANEQAYWQNVLQQGVSRNDVANAFVLSTEFVTRQAEASYADYLNRPADAAGAAYWVSTVQQHFLNLGQVSTGVLASDEAYEILQGGGGGGGNLGGHQIFPIVPMPTTDNKDRFWTGTKNDPNNVVFNDPAVLNLGRTVTLTNDDPNNEIFPFFRAANSRTEFDTLDNGNNEYRAYVGFQLNGVSYFGLLPGESITLKIPMVFWDSGRIYYTTDPRNITNNNNKQKGEVMNNPLLYYATDLDGQPTRRYIDAGTGDTTIASGSQKKPAVLYYHAQVAEGVTNAAPVGFVELAIKDLAQDKINGTTHDKIVLGPLVSYDVSFVDTISLPGALEAPLANVPPSIDGNYATAANGKPFGWVGASAPFKTYQTFIGRFTGDKTADPADTAPNPLGNFFGGAAWPEYYITPVTLGPNTIQVPATKNVFEQSPLRAVVSPYHDGPNDSVTHHIMATGGSFFQLPSNATAKSNGTILATDLTTITDVDPTVIAQLRPGMQIQNVGTTVTFAKYTSIESLSPATNSIKLTGPASGPSSANAFSFIGSQFGGATYSGKTDGAAQTLTVDNFAALDTFRGLQQGQVVSGPGITGVVRIDSISQAVLKLKAEAGATIASAQGVYAVTGGQFAGASSTGKVDGAAKALTVDNQTVLATLRPGVRVTGPGITGVVTIASISSSVITLGTAPGASVGSGQGTYVFASGTFAGPSYSGKADGQVESLTLDDPALRANLQKGMLVTGPGISGVVTVDSISAAGVITLTKAPDATVASAQGAYVFTAGLSDYAAQDLLNLWYAWADYYVSYVNGLNLFAPFGATDSVTIDGDLQGTRVNNDPGQPLNFTQLKLPTSDKTKALRVGMAVTGGTLPTDPIYSAAIASIIPGQNPGDPTIVNLSKTGTAAATGVTFTFKLPKQIERTESLVSFDTSKNPDKLSFGNTADLDKANAFAAVVYSVMNAFSGAAVNRPKDGGGIFDSLALMQNVVGGNIALIPNIGLGDDMHSIQSVSAGEIRDQSKSLERAVADFRAVPSYDWYADPAVPTSGVNTGGGAAAFNVYGLDPFVWFVHEYLGVSGYAFSLDDDAANPTVGGAQTLDVSVGGIKPLKNKFEWSPGAQFGPLPSTATTATVKGTLSGGANQITGITQDAFNYLSNPPKGASDGALVVGPGIEVAPASALQTLARIAGNGVSGTTVQLIGGKLADNASGNYVFFGAVHVTGTIDAKKAPNKISTLSDDDVAVLKAITADPSSLAGLLVSGPGIKAGAKIQSIGADNSITLTDGSLDPTAPVGQFRFKIL